MQKTKYISRYKLTKNQRKYFKIKRFLDIFFAIILLIPSSIVIGIVSIWVKLESRGPLIYKQARTGFHQHVFYIYKIRSMRVEVRDKKGRALSDEERLTKSGRFVRKTSIDELPQLINILKGEMSFIGPRPLLINDLDTYNEKQLIRFEVMPGITSYTALFGRANQSIQEKYNHEIYYVKHFSFMLDFYILIRTIGIVLSQKNVEDNVNEGRIAAYIIDDNEKLKE